MKLIVGLGNPGTNYDLTRHNIGFFILDTFLKEEKWSSKLGGLYIEKIINNEKYLFVKPQSFMNLSGGVVKKFVDYYKINISDILIIHDDLDLPIGKYRLKINSSAGGHNGIKDIISNLHTDSFARLKIGISNNKDIDTKDYVLGKFYKKELEEINKLIPVFSNIITDFSNNNIDVLMNKYN